MTLIRKVANWQEDRPGFYPQGIFEESATQKMPLGHIRPVADGRLYAYAQAGAVALAAGKLTQNVAPVANHLNCVVYAAAAIGAKTVQVTLGATALTANYYKNGWLHVNDATGEGHLYKVRGHAAADASAVATIYLYDAIRVALTTSSEVTLTVAEQSAVIVAPTTLTASIAGVPPIAVTATYYFWNQVKGDCCCLIDGTVAIGEEVAPSNTVAGAVEALVHATTFDTTVGVVRQVNADTEYGLIRLAVPGY